MAEGLAGRQVEVARLPADFVRWAELLDLIQKSFAYMDGLIDPPSSAKRLTPSSLAAKAGAETILIATTAGRLIGCLFLDERDDHFYLGKLAVDPALQRRGVGASLLETAEALARAAGKPLIELQTRIELTGNHAAFQKLSFRETGRTAHPGFSRPTSVTMRKALA